MPFVILIIAIFASYYFLKNHFKAKAKQRFIASKLAIKVHKAIGKVNNGSTVSTRINNCRIAIKLLFEIAEFDPKCKVVTNRHELLSMLRSAKKVIPIEKSIDKYEKSIFKGHEKQALNALLDAIYYCNQNGISNNDFRNMQSRDNTETPITLNYLETRAKGLGWTNCDEK